MAQGHGHCSKVEGQQDASTLAANMSWCRLLLKRAASWYGILSELLQSSQLVVQSGRLDAHSTGWPALETSPTTFSRHSRELSSRCTHRSQLQLQLARVARVEGNLEHPVNAATRVPCDRR